MPTTIHFYGLLKNLVKEKLEVNLRTEEILFLDLIRDVVNEYPTLSNFIKVNEKYTEVKGLSVLVNGRYIVFVGGDRARIRDRGVIDVLPPLHGG